MRLIVLLSAALAFVGSNAHAGPIHDGREWSQPADIVGYSWNDFNAICGMGTCNGLIGLTGPDLTGWTWATAYDLGELFHAYSAHPGGLASYQTSFSDGVNIGNNLQFSATWSSITAGVSGYVGLTATLVPAGNKAYLGGMTLNYGFSGTPGATLFTNDEVSLGFSDNALGAWLYRSASVPAPATIPLLVFGLGALGWFRTRKRIQKYKC